MSKKDITIVTSLVGAGLEREYLLLRDLLQSHGHYVMGHHYTDFSSPLHPSDIMISFEVVMPQSLHISREKWLVPNSEWWDARNDSFLPHFTKIICKTTDCYDLWCKKVGADKCVYTSFEARDIFDPTVPRELRCLHVAGKSEHKNTEAVCRAWRMTQKSPPLTIIARAPLFDAQWSPNAPFPHPVTRFARVEDAELIRLMNSHQIHVIPSMYEGFGHVIHEALSCGAIVVTTDAPPMNTYAGISRDCLVRPTIFTKRALAQLNTVEGPSVYEAVQRAVAIARQSNQPLMDARQGFLDNREFFRTKFMELVNAV